MRSKPGDGEVCRRPAAVGSSGRSRERAGKRSTDCGSRCAGTVPRLTIAVAVMPDSSAPSQSPRCEQGHESLGLGGLPGRWPHRLDDGGIDRGRGDEGP